MPHGTIPAHGAPGRYNTRTPRFGSALHLRLGSTRDLHLLSASRRFVSPLRLCGRAVPLALLLAGLVTGLMPDAVAQANAAQGDLRMAAPSTTVLSSEGAADGRLTLEVRISPLPDAQGERGTVTFLDRDTAGVERSLGSALVSPDGTARLLVAGLAPGAHDVHANFSGTAASSASASTPLVLTGNAVTPDFSLTATPSTLNVTAGQQGSVQVSVTPAAGFNNYVSLSCAGLPLYSSCIFLPTNVAVTGVAGSSTMTLETVAPSGKLASLRDLSGHDSGLVYAFLLPGVLGLAGLGWGRRGGLRTLSLFCVMISLIGGASSCAQRYTYLNHGPTPNQGTPNGESIIRIYGTAVSGAQSVTKCIQLTLNVTSTNKASSGNNLTPCS